VIASSIVPESERDWLSAMLVEAWTDLTLLLVLGFIAAVTIRSRAGRAARSRASMRGTGFLLLLHIGSLPFVSYLQTTGDVADLASYRTWHLLSVTLATIAGITIALAILFDGILRWVRAEVPRIVQDVVAAGAYVIGGLFLLSAWGVNLGGLIATSAVLTAVIGFSLQDTLGNLMGGMTLQMEKLVRPGDWIQVGDKIGRVLEVRWRQTTLETRDWETIVLPNSLLAKNQVAVIGRRFGEPVQYRRKVMFELEYRYNPTDVVRTIEEALRRAPMKGVASDPPPDCVHLDMRGGWHSYAARYFLTQLDREEAVDSSVRTRISFALLRTGLSLVPPSYGVSMITDSDEQRQRKDALDRTSVDVLRSAELFHSLSGEEIAQLVDSLRYSPFSAAEVMTRQGSQGHDLYLIHRGQVSVRVSPTASSARSPCWGPAPSSASARS